MRVAGPALAAGALTFAAIVVWGGLPGSWLLRIRGLRSGRSGSASRVDVRAVVGDLAARSPSLAAGAALVAAGVLAGTVCFASGIGPGVGALRGALASGLALAGWYALSRRVHARRMRARRDTWQEACEAMAAQLRAGRSAEQALAAAALACPDLESVARGLALGADVPTALRAVRDSEAARSLAAAWATAETSGAALGPVVERVLDEIEAGRHLGHEVDAQLAGPLTTTRVLAVLPVGGIGLGYLLGVDVPHLLLSTTLGLGCLCAGAALSAAGLLWVHRLADSVRPR